MLLNTQQHVAWTTSSNGLWFVCTVINLQASNINANMPADGTVQHLLFN